MANWVELHKEWEIHVLIIVSFMLQVFLFFIGGLRRYTSNSLLRFSLWLAYLGADSVAVYALGYLSRHDTLGDTHKLAFLWAPFLLIHLGGQDTVTAFAIEDNNLWLRHLLNLVVQVSLALYVFWNSVGWQNRELLVPGIFVFIAGIIKYAERTLALMYGDLKHAVISIKEQIEPKSPETNSSSDYCSIVRFALYSAGVIQDILVGRSIWSIVEPTNARSLVIGDSLDYSKVFKLLEVELAMAYDSLYTKAEVLRKRIGIIFRLLSLLSIVVALVLFYASNLQRYNKIDIAITYTLFIGSILLDGCGIFVMVMLSPWTWAWLEAREYLRLAGVSWFLLSCKLGWPEERALWSKCMGNYSLSSYMGYARPSRLSQRVMMMIRKMAGMVGIGWDRLFWLSNLLDTEHVQVDDKLTKGLLQGVRSLRQTLNHDEEITTPNWTNLRTFLEHVINIMESMPISYMIVYLHIFTEVHLSQYPPPSDVEANAAETASVDVLRNECRKLSNYMLYLLATQPSMLRLTPSSLQETVISLMVSEGQPDLSEDLIRDLAQGCRISYWGGFQHPPACKETLEEMKEMWILFMLYAAGKSRPEAHAAQLARGGELLTFAWLLMAHLMVGDVGESFEFNDIFKFQNTSGRD